MPKSVEKVFKELTLRFEENIQACNSMNLAYACESFNRLRYAPNDLILKINSRFTELLEQIELRQTPVNHTVPQINIPMKGFSMYFGSKDLTIPTIPVPGYSMFKVLKYLNSAETLQTLPFLYKRCAEILNNLNMFELDKKLLIEGLNLFGKLSEGMLYDSEIKDCMLNMGQLVLKYYQELTITEVNKIANSIMQAGGFRLTT